MPRLAFVFPGQGAQHPGMEKDFYDNYTEAATVFKTADDIAGYSISSLCFNGPADKLNQTEYAQPALLVSSLAAFAVLKKHDIKADMMAGLSLGEYSALTAAETIDLKQALPLVQKRAHLMQNAVPAGEGGMAAVLGLDAAFIEETCTDITGIVVVANYNCPGQAVISGEAAAVIHASAVLKAAGGRIVPLAVSVPSHSPLMQGAALRLRPYLEAIDWQEPSVPVISNVNATENNAVDFTDLLVKQLFSPVRWEQSIRYMMEKADYFIEVGPGNTLSGLIKKIDRNRILGQVNDAKSLEIVMEKVKSL